MFNKSAFVGKKNNFDAIKMRGTTIKITVYKFYKIKTQQWYLE